MITAEYIQEAKEDLINRWGKDGEKIIAECEKITSLNMTSTEFYTHCITITKYWDSKVILSGLKELVPQVYVLIPNDLGIHPFIALGNILILCGVDGTMK